MEITKQFVEETVIFMKAQGVCSFEVSQDGTMKVSFDPRSFNAPEEITADVIKQKLKDLVVDGEEKMKREEEEFLYGST